MKRAFSLRIWLIGSIIAMVVVSYLGVGAMAGLNELISQKPDDWAGPRDLSEVMPLVQAVEGAQGQWEDPAWQADITPQLAAEQIGIQAIRPDGRVAFMYPHPAIPGAEGLSISAGPYTMTFSLNNSLRSGARIYDDGTFAGWVHWLDLRPDPTDYRDEVRHIWETVFIPVAIGLIIIGTIWLFVSLSSRLVIGPLRAVSQAAARINQGDLDVTVPTSRVKELNQFAAAFAQMRAGLKDSLGAQAAMEQERRMFIAAMAHDLRTPLTSVRGYLEGIRDGVARTPEKMDHYVAIALEKAGTMERLVDGLFNYSKTEYLEQAPHRELLRVDELAAAAAAGVKPAADAKGVAIDLDAPPESHSINADAAMLHRVLDNLLDNALRHTPGGGTVTVGWRCGFDNVRIWVQDTGPGIPPEDLARVFEPLYRSDKARSTRTGGAGLGLAIARRLVEAHGGSISATNENGARFTITLPIAPVTDGPQGER
ncbi:MAG TPA: HAMP domain-containing sensor histidine kinase [Symbiobacteriaceae bacterium]|nr:HAMP domain-containing sensor histidine kinase [Symbiobacteriaceae bacterium]